MTMTNIPFKPNLTPEQETKCQLLDFEVHQDTTGNKFLAVRDYGRNGKEGGWQLLRTRAGRGMMDPKTYWANSIDELIEVVAKADGKLIYWD